MSNEKFYLAGNARTSLAKNDDSEQGIFWIATQKKRYCNSLTNTIYVYIIKNICNSIRLIQIQKSRTKAKYFLITPVSLVRIIGTIELWAIAKATAHKGSGLVEVTIKYKTRSIFYGN